MDITGPFITSLSGTKYVLVIIDQFSKWLECHAISEQTAEIIAETFFNEWVIRFGTLTQIHTDQGSNFEGKLFKALCHLLEITKNMHNSLSAKFEWTSGTIQLYPGTICLMFPRWKQLNWDKYGQR